MIKRQCKIFIFKAEANSHEKAEQRTSILYFNLQLSLKYTVLFLPSICHSVSLLVLMTNINYTVLLRFTCIFSPFLRFCFLSQTLGIRSEARGSSTPLSLPGSQLNEQDLVLARVKMFGLFIYICCPCSLSSLYVGISRKLWVASQGDRAEFWIIKRRHPSQLGKRLALLPQ